jgi:predicted nucleic acid-binding Zn ribbon protein
MIQGIKSKPRAKCPCGNITTHRLICAGGGIIFKGKGWPGQDLKRKEEGTYEKE